MSFAAPSTRADLRRQYEQFGKAISDANIQVQ